MSNTGFNVSELDEFTQQLLYTANVKLPTECKKFMRSEGTKLKKVVSNNARSSVKKKKGNYYKSIKRGKVYNYNDSLAIRVYSYDPKAHLIEDGHRIVTRGKGKKAKKHYTNSNGGVEVGFAKGYKVFDRAYRSYSSTFEKNSKEFVNDVFNEGLKL